MGTHRGANLADDLGQDAEAKHNAKGNGKDRPHVVDDANGLGPDAIKVQGNATHCFLTSFRVQDKILLFHSGCKRSLNKDQKGIEKI